MLSAVGLPEMFVIRLTVRIVVVYVWRVKYACILSIKSKNQKSHNHKIEKSKSKDSKIPHIKNQKNPPPPPPLLQSRLSFPVFDHNPLPLFLQSQLASLTSFFNAKPLIPPQSQPSLSPASITTPPPLSYSLSIDNSLLFSSITTPFFSRTPRLLFLQPQPPSLLSSSSNHTSLPCFSITTLASLSSITPSLSFFNPLPWLLSGHLHLRPPKIDFPKKRLHSQTCFGRSYMFRSFFLVFGLLFLQFVIFFIFSIFCEFSFSLLAFIVHVCSFFSISFIYSVLWTLISRSRNEGESWGQRCAKP